jgi:thioesterase domain-containing protein
VEDIVGRLKLSGLEKYDIPATRLCQKLRVQVSNARALFSYEPEKYPFRITFVVAEESKDAELGWQELVTGGLDIHQVPGTHESIINNPHVSRVGDVMRKCLAKA